MDKKMAAWEWTRSKHSCFKIPYGSKAADYDWRESTRVRTDVGPYDPNEQSNIAMVYGNMPGCEEPFTVLDVDDMDLFTKWYKEKGAGWDLTKERVHRTASGKYHILFKWNRFVAKEVTARVSNLLKKEIGCEFFCEPTGYIIAPPSYVFVLGTEKKAPIKGWYRAFYDNPMNSVYPNCLLHAVRDAQEKLKARPTGFGSEYSPMTVAQILGNPKHQEGLATEGNRDNYLHWLIRGPLHEATDIEDYLVDLPQLIKDAGCTLSLYVIKNKVNRYI